MDFLNNQLNACSLLYDAGCLRKWSTNGATHETFWKIEANFAAGRSIQTEQNLAVGVIMSLRMAQ